MTGSDPDDWKTVITCKVYKKERLNCANYARPEPQHAFRPGRRTINLTFAFKNILEKSRKYAIDRYIALLDLVKAFDPGGHSGMPKSKPEHRIPPKIN